MEPQTPLQNQTASMGDVQIPNGPPDEPPREGQQQPSIADQAALKNRLEHYFSQVLQYNRTNIK